jgi:hypothetical protein
MRVWKFAPVAVVGVFVFALVGCDPITHPNFTSKAGPTSPVTFELLSGDGAFAVVRTTAAFGTLPGAGRFRVKRSDGTSDALPSSGTAVRISRDGSRVLISASGAPTVWSSGTLISAPAGAQFSDDLTHAVFRDSSGAIKTWVTATQTVGDVETGFPRPAGTTSALPKGISNDGRTVEYELEGTQHVERFVDLDANQKVDQPNQTSTGDVYVTDEFMLAAGGGGFVHMHEEGHFDFSIPAQLIDESWAELMAVPSGSAGRRYDNTTQEGIVRLHVSADATAAWVYQERHALDGEDGCPSTPAVMTCVVESHALLLRRNGWRTFNTGRGALDGSDAPPDARFLALTKNAFTYDSFRVDGPVRVLDWLTGTVESLTASENYTSSDAVVCAAHGRSSPCTVPAESAQGQMSDDGRTIATTTETGSGWYEYTASSS